VLDTTKTCVKKTGLLTGRQRYIEEDILVERAEGEKLGFGLRYTVFPFLFEARLALDMQCCYFTVDPATPASKNSASPYFFTKDYGWLNNAIFLTPGSCVFK
jgi:hypothetical protein